MFEPTIPPPDPREGKLPVWAQGLIAECRQAAQEWRGLNEAARLATKPDKTDTIIDQYAELPIGLPVGAEVTFFTEPLRPNPRRWDWITCSIREELSGRYLQIHGSGPVFVRATASNSFRLGVDR